MCFLKDSNPFLHQLLFWLSRFVQGSQEFKGGVATTKPKSKFFIQKWRFYVGYGRNNESMSREMILKEFLDIIRHDPSVVRSV